MTEIENFIEKWKYNQLLNIFNLKSERYITYCNKLIINNSEIYNKIILIKKIISLYTHLKKRVLIDDLFFKSEYELPELVLYIIRCNECKIPMDYDNDYIFNYKYICCINCSKMDNIKCDGCSKFIKDRGYSCYSNKNYFCLKCWYRLNDIFNKNIQYDEKIYYTYICNKID